MAGYIKLFTILLLMFVGILDTTVVRAELVFNIQNPEFKETSRKSGASLFGAIAEIFQLLAAVEEQRGDDVPSVRNSAIKKLQATVDTYGALIDRIRGRDRDLDHTRLAGDRFEYIQRIFGFYGVKIPNRESEVILLGFRESEGLLKELGELEFKLDENDRQRIQPLIDSIDRILYLGAAASEFAETAR